MIGEFLIVFARLANFKVEMLSPNASIDGEIMAIKVVLQLPPKESSSNLVILLSLYGI